MDTNTRKSLVSRVYVFCAWAFNVLGVLFSAGVICELLHVRLPGFVEEVYHTWTSADAFLTLLLLCVGVMTQMLYVRTRIHEYEQVPDTITSANEETSYNN